MSARYKPLHRTDLPPLPPATLLVIVAAFLLLGAVLLAATILRTGALPDHTGLLRTATLSDRELTVRSADWRPYDIAMKEHFVVWCDRPDTPPCEDGWLSDPAFLTEFHAMRDSYLGSLTKSDLSGADLRGAEMFRTFLAGSEMRDARLDGAALEDAVLEGVILTEAGLDGTDLTGAALDRATITAATVAGAVFRRASLVDATLGVDALTGGDFRGADLTRARLRGRYQGDFSSDNIVGPTLFSQADLSGVVFENSLIGGTLDDEAFRGTILLGLVEDVDGSVSTANARPARFDGSALQFLDLTHTHIPIPESLGDPDTEGGPFTPPELLALWRTALRNSFGDASVRLPPYVRPPCPWLPTRTEPLEVFYGTWRAWLEKGGRPWPPPGVMADTMIGVEAEDGSRAYVPLADVPTLPERVKDCEWR